MSQEMRCFSLFIYVRVIPYLFVFEERLHTYQFLMKNYIILKLKWY